MAVARNAGEILDEAFAGFLDAACEYADAHPDLDLDEDEDTESDGRRATVPEVESLDLAR